MSILKILFWVLGAVVYLNIGFLFGKLCLAKDEGYCPKFLEILLWPISSRLTPKGFRESAFERIIQNTDPEAYIGLMTFFWPIKLLFNVVVGIAFYSLLFTIMILHQGGRVVTYPMRHFSGKPKPERSQND